mgnify:CR=1 FL=1
MSGSERENRQENEKSLAYLSKQTQHQYKLNATNDPLKTFCDKSTDDSVSFCSWLQYNTAVDLIPLKLVRNGKFTVMHF